MSFAFSPPTLPSVFASEPASLLQSPPVSPEKDTDRHFTKEDRCVAKTAHEKMAKSHVHQRKADCYCFTPSRMATIRRSQGNWNPAPWWWAWEMGQGTLSTVWQFLCFSRSIE